MAEEGKEGKEPRTPKTEVVTVKMSEAELEALDSLIPVLRESGRIPSESRSEVIRLAVRVLLNQVLSEVEARRFY
jgi:Arc/MetJ-type ribon-helix-helix transcriptional regulator